MPNTRSPDGKEQLEKERANLQNVQSRAAEELVKKGHADEHTDDELAARLERIRGLADKEKG